MCINISLSHYIYIYIYMYIYICVSLYNILYYCVSLFGPHTFSSPRAAAVAAATFWVETAVDIWDEMLADWLASRALTAVICSVSAVCIVNLENRRQRAERVGSPAGGINQHTVVSPTATRRATIRTCFRKKKALGARGSADI